MKRKYIFALFIFAVLTISTYYISKVKIATPVEVKEVFATASLKSNCTIKEIKESTEKYNIEVYYPETKYPELNAKIKEVINKYILEFKEQVIPNYDVSLVKMPRDLNINFDSYECDNYISYVFHIFADTAGAHPNTYIYTISYDIQKRKIITIDDLINKNKDILNIFSKISYDILKENQAIKEYGNEDMLVDGTRPIKENFENFAFDEQGIILFFEKYAVAPYVAGEFTVCIPYDKIK